jgi:predicted Rossmann-fold nucleotide-binding protein
VQTGKVMHFPIVLFGSSYWSGLVDWLRARALAEGKVSAEDLDIFHVCDDPESALEHIQQVLARRAAATEPTSLPHVAAHKSDAQ